MRYSTNQMDNSSTIDNQNLAQISAAPLPYRVLARKYRPTNFDTLIGQESLVRTLTNGIKSNRVAQAFMLTGVRGVGKTTTARIIAKALNCIGIDGQGGTTPSPCGVCVHCVAISEDRHMDVLEIDAASHNGVDEVRELTDTVHYKPNQARYKIFILDEVHMLSNSAFNAILKTLEEPPAHVKFIFATTEIRKVPVTVLSRCQRFDLRRVPILMLKDHYANIAKLEGVEFEEDALSLIARAADGSVRDGLSILDQAIALSGNYISEEAIREMLGLADRTKIWEVYEAILKGQVQDAFASLEILYSGGTDPIVILQDLLEITHFLSRVKMSAALLDNPTTPELERRLGQKLSKDLTLAILTRNWQMLLKGLEETKLAPIPMQALEMVIMRLLHGADMPPLGPLLRKLQAISDQAGVTIPSTSHSSSQSSAYPSGYQSNPPASAYMPNEPMPQPRRQNTGALATQLDANPVKRLNSFEEVAELLLQNNDKILANFIRTQIRPVSFKYGQLSFRAISQPQEGLIGKLSSRLRELTGQNWLISLMSDKGDNSLAEASLEKERTELAKFEEIPAIKALYDAIPGTKLVRVIQKSAIQNVAALDQMEVDPIEDDPITSLDDN